MDLDLNIFPPLPRDRSIGIGCIGAGFIMADCQLVAYRQSGLNPVAIAARSREKAAGVARRHNIPAVYEDYRQLMDDPGVRVLDIAVPPDVQFEVIEQAVKRAGHIRGILAQKPLGVDYRQARRIVQCVNRRASPWPSIRTCGSTTPSAPAKHCSIAASWASRCWRPSTCAPSPTGCPGSSGSAG